MFAWQNNKLKITSDSEWHSFIILLMSWTAVTRIRKQQQNAEHVPAHYLVYGFKDSGIVIEEVGVDP